MEYLCGYLIHLTNNDKTAQIFASIIFIIDMGKEIEHKYLAKDIDYDALCERSENIMQGYLCRVPERTVRIRIKGERGYITVKGRNHGAMRKEYEYAIPVEEAREMLGLCEGVVISKTRYHIIYEGFEWEVDRFHGSLSGLITAEIELPDEHTAYPIPAFITENVTGDPRYYNSNLENGIPS